MGLDMYVMTTKRQLWKPVDFPSHEGDSQLFYWRKHPNLYGAMLRLYEEKGGKNTDFNCATLQLTAADIDRLNAKIVDRRLPFTNGFFFGTSGNNQAQREYDLQFIARARDALANNLRVYFYAWW